MCVECMFLFWLIEELRDVCGMYVFVLVNREVNPLTDAYNYKAAN
jgi:hypothetical protein